MFPWERERERARRGGGVGGSGLVFSGYWMHLAGVPTALPCYERINEHALLLLPLFLLLLLRLKKELGRVKMVKDVEACRR